MVDMMNFAMNLLNKNPMVANNIRNQNLMRIIQSGDSNAGRKAAENLCATYGTNMEDALAQAKRFFNIG